MTSPDRDPRTLFDPALKIAPGMLDAFDAATDIAAQFARVSARIIDADVLLDPRSMTHRAPRNRVEIFADPTGILVVASGRSSSLLYWAQVHVPAMFDAAGNLTAVADRAVRAALWWHVTCGLKAIDRQSAPGIAGP